MNTMAKSVMAGVVVGAVLGTAGFFAGIRAGRAAPEADGAPDVEEAQARPNAENASALDRAKKRVRELESEVAALREKMRKQTGAVKTAGAPEDAETDAPEELAGTQTMIPGSNASISVSIGTSNDDILKQIRKQVPKEHFAEVTNVFAKLRERNLGKSRGKVQYLAGIDTSEMTDSQRKNHQRYLELLTRMEELSAKNTGFLPDMATLQQQVELQTELTPLAKEERKLLVDQLSRSLGYEGEDAAVIGSTVQDIVDATSPSGMIGTAIATSVEEIGGLGLGAPKPAKTE